MRRGDPRLQRPREEGAILILFALFLVGFLGVAALVVDVRIAALSQQQMQVAADFATMEGLATGILDGADQELVGRQAAVSAVSWTFDDDYVLDLTPDRLQLGAGPRLDLEGGQAGTNAGAMLQPAGVYDPRLQLNLGNEPTGDLVLGEFVPVTVPTETSNYVRNDFDPDGDLGSFLVRLRRTRNALGLDQVAGVSSAGPPLPLIFGLGTTIRSSELTSGNIRTDGLNVRASAISEARRALSVSPRSVLRVGILVSTWETLLSPGSQIGGTVGTNGVWLSGGVAIGGRVDTVFQSGSLRHVGQTVQLSPGGLTPLSEERVVPLIQPRDAQPVEAGGAAWIIGFVRVQVSIDASVTGWTLSRVPSRVLAGASAASGEALRILTGGEFPASEWESFSDPVLAPALVR